MSFLFDSLTLHPLPGSSMLCMQVHLHRPHEKADLDPEVGIVVEQDGYLYASGPLHLSSEGSVVWYLPVHRVGTRPFSVHLSAHGQDTSARATLKNLKAGPRPVRRRLVAKLTAGTSSRDTHPDPPRVVPAA